VCGAVWCSVMQYVAVCCSVLQRSPTQYQPICHTMLFHERVIVTHMDESLSHVWMSPQMGFHVEGVFDVFVVCMYKYVCMKYKCV